MFQSQILSQYSYPVLHHEVLVPPDEIPFNAIVLPVFLPRSQEGVDSFLFVWLPDCKERTFSSDLWTSVH